MGNPAQRAMAAAAPDVAHPLRGPSATVVSMAQSCACGELFGTAAAECPRCGSKRPQFSYMVGTRLVALEQASPATVQIQGFQRGLASSLQQEKPSMHFRAGAAVAADSPVEARRQPDGYVPEQFSICTPNENTPSSLFPSDWLSLPGSLLAPEALSASAMAQRQQLKLQVQEMRNSMESKRRELSKQRERQAAHLSELEGLLRKGRDAGGGAPEPEPGPPAGPAGGNASPRQPRRPSAPLSPPPAAAPAQSPPATGTEPGPSAAGPERPAAAVLHASVADAPREPHQPCSWDIALAKLQAEKSSPDPRACPASSEQPLQAAGEQALAERPAPRPREEAVAVARTPPTRAARPATSEQPLQVVPAEYLDRDPGRGLRSRAGASCMRRMMATSRDLVMNLEDRLIDSICFATQLFHQWRRNASLWRLSRHYHQVMLKHQETWERRHKDAKGDGPGAERSGGRPPSRRSSFADHVERLLSSTLLARRVRCGRGPRAWRAWVMFVEHRRLSRRGARCFVAALSRRREYVVWAAFRNWACVAWQSGVEEEARKWEDKIQSLEEELWQAYRQIHQLTVGVRREPYRTEGAPVATVRLNASR